MNDPRIVSDKRSSLESFFSPKSVAVIGATDRERAVGRSVLQNLSTGSFRGKIYPVNPKRKETLGLPTFARVGEIPETVDLAVIITPAITVPAVVGECVDASVRAAIVISAGFKERGAEGAALEAKIQEQLRRSPMRLVGPNCLGVMNPNEGLNATFARDIARPGRVAFLSQSGALLTAILDWSLAEQVGFSAIVSTGSMLDVGWGDLIDFFGDDPATESILLYMESVGDARAFLSAAREVALRKPIIVIKAGRTAAASKAASSHTGALTGSDEVFDAALRRCGVLRVSTIADLFHMADTLGKQPRPRGPHLTILTNAGGPGVLATDQLLSAGGELTELSDSTLAEMNRFLPESWSHGNPIDILGDADAERYSQALEIAASDPKSDGLIVILAPQAVTAPLEIAERLKPYAKGLGKPLLASWMGGATVGEGVAALSAAGIPTFSYPDAAVRAFTYMWKFSYNLKGIYETPFLTDDLQSQSEAKSRVASMLANLRSFGRTILTEAESKQILREYGIPTVETRVARSEEEAVLAAQSIGFPVVLKLHSETITHKSDVGGVKLNLRSDVAVRDSFRAIQSSVREKAGEEAFLGVTVQPQIELDGYELILGSSIDTQFGPVILFGSGGELVEVYHDRGLALPPLNSTLAVRLMEQTRIYRALQGVRGLPPIDMKALENTLVHFSRLVVEQPWIKEIDINPLLASPEKLTALDARILLQPAGIAQEQLPRPAIRPYPVQYISSNTLKDGTAVTLRPIRPEDEPAIAKFHETLSDRTVYLRYFHMEQLSTRVAHERLTRICFIDYAREMALVAVWNNPETGQAEIIAVGRLSRIHRTADAEVAVLVTDRFQHRGVGGAILSRLLEIAKDEKIEHIEMSILMENSGMRALASRHEFQLQKTGDMSVVKAVLALNAPLPAAS